MTTVDHARAAAARRVVAAAALALSLAAGGASAQQAILHGTVTDSATGSPLAGARIEVAADRVLAAAFTDERGRWRMRVPAPGIRTVAVRRIGYAPARRMLELEAGGDVMLDVSLAALGLALDPVVVTASRAGTTAFEAPASVSVVDRSAIERQPALTPVEHVRSSTGMDMARKGLVQNAYAVRGERGSVSGALLTLTDFRNSDVPSLALNIPYLLAATDDDIERIELVRGPGAALYGPGADRGVLHFITRSPFESPGGTLTVTGGSRSLLGATARYAAVLSPRLAVKLSADYLRGRDWPYLDSVEAANRAAALAGGALPDTLRIGRRESNLARAGGEARLDWRPAPGTEVVATAGLADAIRIVELGGDVGSVQGVSWRYQYVQARLSAGRTFANVFYNLSNTGRSYVLRTGKTVVDSSRVLAAQLQHSSRVGPLDLLYGADLRWTDPRTGGTIDGENEDRDQITELGAYLHGTAALTSRLEGVAALRLDHHSRLADLAVSPRLGLVFRPSVEHALRLTYNRAFTSPDANTLSLDIVSGSLPGLPYLVRASSVPRGGYHMRRDCGGLCMSSPFGGAAALPTDATLLWPAVAALLARQGVDISGVPAPSAADVGTNLAVLDPTSGAFAPVTAAGVADIAPLRRTVTDALELGWKAMFRRRYALNVDLYAARVSDVRGSRYVATPNAFFDRPSLAAYLGRYMSPGDAAQLAATIAQIPMGTISPRETTHPTDLLVLSRQGGWYTLWGLDIGFEAPVGAHVTARGSFSWLSRDSVTVSSVPGVFVLGVPRRKGALGLDWSTARASLGLEARWVEGFPVNSGAYVGRVRSYALLDARIGGALPVAGSPRLTLEASNLLDRRHQEFVGAPALGRLLILRLRTEL